MESPEIASIMGFMRESWRYSVICTFLWYKDPIVFLSFINVFKALSRRSLSTLLISPEIVNEKPRYFFVREVSVLLKILHLVLSVFIVISLVSHYEAIDSSIS